jgi:hypothetical protein
MNKKPLTKLAPTTTAITPLVVEQFDTGIESWHG